MSSLVIVDSECANLESVYKALKKIGLDPLVSADHAKINAARALVFPGVGSFAHAASVIRRKGLDQALEQARLANKPFLGICLGMQLLLDESEETGLTGNKERGLGFIPGRVQRFPQDLPVPHVGWNCVLPRQDDPLFSGLQGESYFYFTHSFYACPGEESDILATSQYGFPFAAALRSGNLYGVQFHPEKSGSAGLRLMANFGKIIDNERAF